jgi:hypothetical protein
MSWSCEKCWNDAYLLVDSFESHMEAYQRLLLERSSNPCSPAEQAGQWWDPIKQIDKRKIKLGLTNKGSK